LPLIPVKEGSKPQNCKFSSKIALHLKKVCYKVSLCENCQGKSCKAFIGLNNCAKMIGEGLPILREILGRKVSNILTISCDNSETAQGGIWEVSY